jgi:acetate---CoA ligase (ADP-forming)
MPDLAALLAPKTVAVVGATSDLESLRGRTLKVMLGHRYAGRIHPVSRSHDTVQGLKAYRSVAEIPERVDLAVLIIPAEFVPDELERCARAGVKAALILASGFAEARGGEGAALQRRVQEIARHYDLAVCGPNAEGFANMAAALCPTFSPAVDALEGPLVPEWRTSGHVAVIGQSGGISFSLYDRGRAKQIPFSYVVTTGNEACLESFDVVEHLLGEERTDVFLMFLENVKDPRTFTRAAEKALRAGKPIIVYKVGQSEAGRRATASHTAALAGEYETYRAMFRRYGLIEAGDSEEMVDLAAGFSVYRDRLPAGKRIGICTPSGGGGAWAADACAAMGLEVPELDAATRAKIDAHIPSYGTSQNPVDCTAQAFRKLGVSALASLLSSSESIDTVFVVTTARSVEGYERDRENLFRVAREARKPILLWSYTNPAPASARLLSEAGYPLYTNPRNCARVAAEMANYRAFRERMLRPSEVRSANEFPKKKVQDRLASAGPVLCEYEAAALLADYGVPFPKSLLVSDADAAVAAAAKLTGPVALKLQSPDILHKTEAGGVALGLEGGDAVRESFQSILQKTRHAKPGADIRGILVQAMAPKGVEMILGVNRDDVFGPMLMVGLGGIHVEVLKDVALAPVPLSADQARELLDRLKGRAILNGVRGAPPSDIEALVDLMVKLAAFAADHAERLSEIDLNPVIVHPKGQGVSVVDALIVTRPSREDAR